MTLHGERWRLRVPWEREDEYDPLMERDWESSQFCLEGQTGLEEAAQHGEEKRPWTGASAPSASVLTLQMQTITAAWLVLPFGLNELTRPG